MPITSRWMPLVTVLVLGLAVGGAAESVVAAVAVVAALLGGHYALRGRGRVLPLAALGAVAGTIGAAGSPRSADALTLRAVPGGYALSRAGDGGEVFRAEGRNAKRACLRAAAAGGALRVRFEG